MNDTTRELGGALGVAVIGSVLSSLYRSDITARMAGLPAAAHAATTSLGAALRAANAVPGPAGNAFATAARLSYVHAFDVTIGVTAAVAILASGVVTWLLRPATVELAEEEERVVLEAA